MTMTDDIKRIGLMMDRQSPHILTAVGAAGVVATAILATKATVKATRVLDAEVRKYDSAVDGPAEWSPGFDGIKERLPYVWRYYIPPALTMASTIACVIGANAVQTRRQAALLSAYSMAQTAFVQYKEKVVEQLGESKEQKVRDSVAEDNIRRNSPSSEVIIASGKVLCYESLTGRYFESDIETIRQEQNNVNAQVINEGYASLNDFFSAIGLSYTQYGEELGWTPSNRLDVQFSAILSEDQRPCISLGYAKLPVANYYKFSG